MTIILEHQHSSAKLSSKLTWYTADNALDLWCGTQFPYHVPLHKHSCTYRKPDNPKYHIHNMKTTNTLDAKKIQKLTWPMPGQWLNSRQQRRSITSDSKGLFNWAQHQGKKEKTCYGNFSPKAMEQTKTFSRREWYQNDQREWRYRSKQSIRTVEPSERWNRGGKTPEGSIDASSMLQALQSQEWRWRAAKSIAGHSYTPPSMWMCINTCISSESILRA